MKSPQGSRRVERREGVNISNSRINFFLSNRVLVTLSAKIRVLVVHKSAIFRNFLLADTVVVGHGNDVSVVAKFKVSNWNLIVPECGGRTRL